MCNSLIEHIHTHIYTHMVIIIPASVVLCDRYQYTFFQDFLEILKYSPQDIEKT